MSVSAWAHGHIPLAALLQFWHAGRRKGHDLWPGPVDRGLVFSRLAGGANASGRGRWSRSSLRRWPSLFGFVGAMALPASAVTVVALRRPAAPTRPPAYRGMRQLRLPCRLCRPGSSSGRRVWNAHAVQHLRHLAMPAAPAPVGRPAAARPICCSRWCRSAAGWASASAGSRPDNALPGAGRCLDAGGWTIARRSIAQQQAAFRCSSRRAARGA